MALFFEQNCQARPDILPIFQNLKSLDCEGIEKWRFLEFLANVQRCDMQSATSRNIWEIRADKLIANSSCFIGIERSNRHIDFRMFVYFLTSEECNVYEPNDSSRTRLLRPLNEYFISCSHNTYLTGRQINGDCSVEGYVNALRRGCRSVEIDCWDGRDGNPVVKHGFCKTPSILFVDVIHTINTYAFNTSPYPVIVSLEVHCNFVQQARMVEIIKEIFADRILFQPLSDHVSDLPSPEELKYKILLKVKSMQVSPNKIVQCTSLTPKPTRTRSAAPYVPLSSFARHPLLQLQEPRAERECKTKKTPLFGPNLGFQYLIPGKVTPELAGLCVYFQSFSSTDGASLTAARFNHILSLSEKSATALPQDPYKKIIFHYHNIEHMCRVYPKALRVDSSNFNPNVYWRHGVQMVALNYQTYDANMQMNQAMFAAGSDRTGYVLKPGYLRKPRTSTYGIQDSLVLALTKIEISVTMISVQQLHKLSNLGNGNKTKLIIRVRACVAENGANKEGAIVSPAAGDAFSVGACLFGQRAEIGHNNGQHPRLASIIQLSVETSYPELVFIQFSVYPFSKRRERIAVFTAKLNRLQCGYRHIPLYDKYGRTPISSTIFCRIQRHPQILFIQPSDTETVIRDL